MNVLSLKNISKSFGIDEILRDVNISINEGDKIGFIGENGAGKSTLLKIITGELEEDTGEIYIEKGKKLGYLTQTLSLNPSSTIYEEMLSVFSNLISIEEKLKVLEEKMAMPYTSQNSHIHEKAIKDYSDLTELYKNRGGYNYKILIGKVLKGLNFTQEDYNKEIQILSGGQKTRLSLCKLLLTSPDILLLDEPTNHLDLEAIEWLEEYLKEFRGTLLVISHDRFFLDSVTEKTFELSKGLVYTYNGIYTKYITLKKERMEQELKAYTLQQVEIKRQEEIIERYRSFNREKSIRAAESREKALSKLERIEAPTAEPSQAKIKFETRIKSGNDVLFVEELKKSFPSTPLFEGVSFELKRGDKTALIGDNGIGKTTLLKIILGRVQKDMGEIILGKNVIPGYYDQEQSDLNLSKTIIDEVWDMYPDMKTTEIRNALAAFLFKGDEVFKEISLLSGGEKCRINLLKLMLSKSNFLLLDEPTNHLDIASREALEDALLSYDGTLFVISHDRYFLNKVINKILDLSPVGVKEYLGNYSYYIEKKTNPQRFQEIQEGEEKSKTFIEHNKKKKKEEEKKKKEREQAVKNVESSIEEAEESKRKLEESLCLEENYKDPTKCKNINSEINKLKNLIAELYDKWEEMT